MRSERTEIAAALGGAAVRVLGGKVLEGGVAGNDVAAEVLELRNGVVTGGGGDEVAVGILPGGLAAGALVLDENMRSPNLLRRGHLGLFTAALLVLVVVVVAVGSIRRRLPLPIGLYFCRLGVFSTVCWCAVLTMTRLENGVFPLLTSDICFYPANQTLLRSNCLL